MPLGLEDRLQIQSDHRIVFQDQNAHAKPLLAGPAGQLPEPKSLLESGNFVPAWKQPVHGPRVPEIGSAHRKFENSGLTPCGLRNAADRAPPLETGPHPFLSHDQPGGMIVHMTAHQKRSRCRSDDAGCTRIIFAVAVVVFTVADIGFMKKSAGFHRRSFYLADLGDQCRFASFWPPNSLSCRLKRASSPLNASSTYSRPRSAASRA